MHAILIPRSGTQSMPTVFAALARIKRCGDFSWIFHVEGHTKIGGVNYVFIIAKLQFLGVLPLGLRDSQMLNTGIFYVERSQGFPSG